MANDYFDTGNYTPLQADSLARSANVNAIATAIEAGFDKLPSEARLKQNRVTHGTFGGTANAHTCTLPHTISSYTAGLHISYVPTLTNTSAVTVNVDGVGAVSIKRPDGTALQAGDVVANATLELRHNGTDFNVIGAPPGMITSAATQATNAATSATAAATSAAAAASSATAAATSETNAAASAAKLSGTSSTSVAIGTGSKAFTTQSGKFFDVGNWLLIASDADESNYMHGQVTAYSGTSLTVNVTNTGGSGTFADWVITVSGTRGATGATGATGPQGPAGADYTADAELNSIAGLVSAADKLPYFTGSGTAALADISTAGRALIDDANAAAQRTTLGLVIGTDVLAPSGSGASLTGVLKTGKQVIGCWGAEAIKPQTTNGCAAIAWDESTTNKVMTPQLSFDAAAIEYAQFKFRAPQGLDESANFTALIVWTEASGAASHDCVWQIEMQAQGDGDTIDSAWGTAITVTDTGTSGTRRITSEFSTITPGGTWAAGDEILVRVSRKATDAADTLNVDAKLIEVILLGTYAASVEP